MKSGATRQHTCQDKSCDCRNCTRGGRRGDWYIFGQFQSRFHTIWLWNIAFLYFCSIVKKYTLLMHTMKNAMIANSPRRIMRATLVCPNVKIVIRGISFIENLTVLHYLGSYVILSMDWLSAHGAVFQCTTQKVILKTESGRMVEFSTTQSN